ncbi:MAG: hypothetical protein ABFR53_06455, partial [Actinomycetota bacterium]
MEETKLSFFVKGNADIVDAALSKADGGTKLDRGVRELVASEFPGVKIEASHESSSGFAALRNELESGVSRLIDDHPQVVLLSLGEDIREFGGEGTNTEEAVKSIEADL